MKHNPLISERARDMADTVARAMLPGLSVVILLYALYLFTARVPWELMSCVWRFQEHRNDKSI
jgi:hypothetical protein